MKRFLNLGSGADHIRQSGVDWWNIDNEITHNPDLCANYLHLPRWFPDDSIDGIISLHSIEHLSWPVGVQTFFAVAFAALKPGGTLRIVVPDLMKVAKLYVAGDDLKGVYGPDFKVEGPDCAATRFMAFARGWQHTVLFDEYLLQLLMHNAGFVNVRVMPFGESDVPELCNLDRFRSESLAIQGCKP